MFVFLLQFDYKKIMRAKLHCINVTLKIPKIIEPMRIEIYISVEF